MIKSIPESKEMKIPKYFYGQTNPESSFILMEDLTKKVDHTEFSGYFFLDDDQVTNLLIYWLSKLEIEGERMHFGNLQTSSFDFQNKKCRWKNWQTVDTSPNIFGFHGSNIENCKVDESFVFIRWTIAKTWNSIKKNSWRKSKCCHNLFVFLKQFQSINFEILVNYPLVLIHDDFWAGNLLFCKDGSLCSVIDWQLISLGCFAEDLAALLGMTLNGKTRRAKQDQFLDFYHSELVKLLPKDHPEAKKLINMSKNDLRTAYKECQKSAVFRVMMTMNNYINEKTRPVYEEMLQSIVEDVFGW